MSVYSTRFIAALGLSPFSGATYTVPSGKVAIVRDIDVSNVSGAASRPFLYYSAAGYVVTYLPIDAPPSASSWRGRQVFEASEVFGVYAQAATINAFVSGYLLDA